MHASYSLFAMAALVSTVVSHGLLTSPKIRTPGPAMDTACGKPVADIVRANSSNHVEGMPEAAAKIQGFNATKCNVFFCKGQQFDDNKANVQKYKAGEVVNFRAMIVVPHEGKMNVSIMNTATQKPIGKPLIKFASYADEKLSKLPANNTDFNVTVPQNLKECSVAGACVMQWLWVSKEEKETYESCVDFTV